ncbi:biopolymer transporter ExbD [Pedobacter sp. HMF7647]|uniref:Biopolymer transporter ExbD n=1 Tax=Hufsiella arboris TaxID=2695275 RepID=A0A7K1YAX7_9SPHI|nr:biopolymer transporter ExbD [Hufsiella arboris]MXV51259.1 biopolymer transporter ExbD [Hufsiella arboris]
MAELTQTLRSNSGRVKRLRIAPRIDLTAMVDLCFLLITFFMLTTTLAKLKAMDVVMPVKETNQTGVSEDRSITICLGANDRLMWYKGTSKKPLLGPFRTNFSKGGIRKALTEQSAAIKNQYKDKQLIVLIKASDHSSYKNLVDILDEMKIGSVDSYAIVDLTKEDMVMMKAIHVN